MEITSPIETTEKRPALPRLKELREAAKLSQIQLAEKTGVGNYAISWFETQPGKIGWHRLKKLADFFGVHPSYLTGERDTP